MDFSNVNYDRVQVRVIINSSCMLSSSKDGTTERFSDCLSKDVDVDVDVDVLRALKTRLEGLGEIISLSAVSAFQ